MNRRNDILTQHDNEDVAGLTHPSRTRLNSMSPLAAIIGRNVRRCRIERDFSLSVLVERTEITLDDLQAIENEHVRPEPEQLLALARALDVSPSALLTEE
ncbi:helix-turn-helix domain-containing protein [Gluconobacter oxydans]|uniref:helix-turn-helix domain-containing protein n=1 Tax=Gluconobacter oxydans TaxID=442 RepID=UPI0039EBD1B3